MLPAGAPDPEGLAGIEGGRVRLVSEGALAAAVSEVPEADFEEGPLNERVRDLGWLGPRAVAHQSVNERLFEAGGATVPLTFGTVFREPEGVRDFLRERAEELGGRLRRLDGRSEWVAALERDARTVEAHAMATSEALRATDAEISGGSPGRAYLLKRQREGLVRREALEVERRALQDLLAALAGVAEASFREPLPDAPEQALTARLSLLVARQREAELAAAAESFGERWRDTGLTLRLTGPWPPYRFASLEAHDPAA